MLIGVLQRCLTPTEVPGRKELIFAFGAYVD